MYVSVRGVNHIPCHFSLPSLPPRLHIGLYVAIIAVMGFSTFGVCQQQVTATVSYFPRFFVAFVYSSTRSIVLQSVGL
jgi:hypothetical protein